MKPFLNDRISAALMSNLIKILNLNIQLPFALVLGSKEQSADRRTEYPGTHHSTSDEQITSLQSPGKQVHPLSTASTCMMNKQMSEMLNERLQQRRLDIFI